MTGVWRAQIKAPHTDRMGALGTSQGPQVQAAPCGGAGRRALQHQDHRVSGR